MRVQKPNKVAAGVISLLVGEHQVAGEHAAICNGLDRQGRPIEPRLYIIYAITAFLICMQTKDLRMP
ncbi:MAG: hypothetical protein RLZZ408_1912 [Verrucomicrobiota bacterium]|jgi:hypothetical protein